MIPYLLILENGEPTDLVATTPHQQIDSIDSVRYSWISYRVLGPESSRDGRLAQLVRAPA